MSSLNPQPQSQKVASIEDAIRMREQLLAMRNPKAEKEAILAELDGKADGIIWSNVLVNAGMGAVPLGINVWMFVGANTTMIIALGYLYGFTVKKEQAAALLKQMFGAVGLT